ncbi:class I SAM-dependent methyltransferase [Halorarum halobium]|uniref:class I SAM-dependent methyltransferase n=1 Tax=Halorarum halobium TaxID=3075121 RepID=UPI0028B0A933|nr:class I SAM-dependent methyltransferase [Halobaculum sp. XH14]
MTDDDDAQRRTVREGYDALAGDYGKSRDPPEAPLVESFLDSLPDGSRLLDVGCGQGSPVLDRLPDAVDAAGLDFSIEQLRYAREATDADLLQADMTALPVANDSADALTALHSLIHVPTEQHPAVVREFGRITGPDAKLLLTANSDGWAGANDDWLGGGARMEWSFPGVEETREQLRAAGFEVVEEELVADELAEGDDDAAWLFLTAQKRGE